MLADAFARLARELAPQVQEMMQKNNAAIATNPDQPIAKLLADDNGLGLMYMLMVEFVSNSPTAQVDNVTMIGPDKAEFVLPIPQLFQGYVERRLALLQQGISTMTGQTLTTYQDLEQP